MATTTTVELDRPDQPEDEPGGDRTPPTPGARVGSALRHPDVRFGQMVAAGALAFLIFVGVLYPAPLPILFLGAVLGSLSALTAMGLVLIYRANRIINFAQGDLGAVAAVLMASLIVGPKWPFFVALVVSLAAALAMGAFVEVAFIRRFSKSPRLILTVATIGIGQLLGFVQLILPEAFDYDVTPEIRTPLEFSFEWGPVIFRGNHLLVMIVVPIVAVALGAFFRFTRIGTAVRASAESSDRALLLGIPVKRIGTLVWVLAAALSATAALLRAPIVGISIGSVIGPGLLLRALAAAVIGRMENLPVTFAAAVMLGMIEQAVFFETGRTIVVDAVLFFVIMGALLLQKKGALSRAEDRGASSWSAVAEVRPVPPELRDVPEVKWGLKGFGLLLAAVLVVLPLTLDPGNVNRMGVGITLAALGISLLILTGWAGQLSLGQWAFAGFGGAIAGTMTLDGWNFFVILLVAGLVGSVVAIVIGIPALRIRGPFLAVATFAFALATFSYFLNPEFFSWYVPVERFPRPMLFGKFDLESEYAFYYVLLIFLGLVLASVRSLRQSRTGRVLVAARDNERAAQAFGVSLVRARLTAFALSGFLAAVTGALFAYHQHTLFQSPISPENSIRLFTIVVVGGLGSVPGVVVSAAAFTTIDLFVKSPAIRLLTSGIGLLLVLLLLPGGLGQLVYSTRDRLLRNVARRRRIVVPSLVADVRVDDAAPGEEVLEVDVLPDDDSVLQAALEHEHELAETNR